MFSIAARHWKTFKARYNVEECYGVLRVGDSAVLEKQEWG